MVRCNVFLLLSILSLLLHTNKVQANIGIFGRNKETTTSSSLRSSSSSSLSLVTNPFDRSDDIKTLDDLILPLLGSIVTTTYGITLILNTKQCEGQLRCMTMFRSTGHNRLEKALREFRKNLKDAMLSVAIRSPSFYFAQRSIKKLDDRIVDAYKLLKDTRQAKSDGIVTTQEERNLRKQRQKEIKNIKRDMRRLVNAGSHIQHVIKSLDIDEISDLMRSFAFQLLAVLSVGEYDGNTRSNTTTTTTTTTRRGSFLANICLLKNLGSLALDVNTKLQFPISTIILNSLTTSTLSSSSSSSCNNENDKFLTSTTTSQQKEKLVENTGKLVTYGTSAYLVVSKNSLARKINNSLLSASVVIRGLKSFIQTMLEYDDDDSINNCNSIWFPIISRFLNGGTGGILMITLATISFYIRDKQEEDLKETIFNDEEDEEEEDFDTDTATATTTAHTNITTTEDFGVVTTTTTTSQQPSSPKMMKIVVPKWIQYIHSRIENAIRKLTLFLEEIL